MGMLDAAHDEVLEQLKRTGAYYGPVSRTFKVTPTKDDVNQPSHYMIAPGIEAIDIIETVLREYAHLDPGQGYLLGNFLKYRLRAGDKGDLQKDIDKSNVYREMLREGRGKIDD